MNLLHDGADAGIIAVAKASNEAELLLAGLFHGFQHGAHSRRIGRHRFLTKDVLACGNCGFQVLRTKAGRCGQKDHVHAAVDHLLVGIQSHEALVRGHLDLARDRRLQLAQAALQTIIKSVPHGGQDNVWIGLQGLVGRSGATSAASNEADLQRFGICASEQVAGQDRRGGENAAHDGGISQELSSGLVCVRDLGLFHISESWWMGVVPGHPYPVGVSSEKSWFPLEYLNGMMKVI